MARMKSTEACVRDEEERRLAVKRVTAELAAAPLGVDTSELRKQLDALTPGGDVPGSRRAIRCSRAELKEKICEFFDSRQVAVVDENGEVIGYQQTAPITITALANWLGLDRKTLVQYARNSDEYGDIITAARAKVEELYEGRLVYGEKNPAGVIFALKNLGWADDIKLSVDGGGERRMSTEEITQMVEEDIVT